MLQCMNKNFERRRTVKKLMMKLGSAVAVLAMTVATMDVNATCCHYIYQEQVPESAMKLSKVK